MDSESKNTLTPRVDLIHRFNIRLFDRLSAYLNGVSGASIDTFEADSFPLLSTLCPFISNQIGKFPETSEVHTKLVSLLAEIEFFQVQTDITVLRLPYEWWSSALQLPSSHAPLQEAELYLLKKKALSGSSKNSMSSSFEPSDSGSGSHSPQPSQLASFEPLPRPPGSPTPPPSRPSSCEPLPRLPGSRPPSPSRLSFPQESKKIGTQQPMQQDTDIVTECV